MLSDFVFFSYFLVSPCIVCMCVLEDVNQSSGAGNVTGNNSCM